MHNQNQRMHYRLHSIQCLRPSVCQGHASQNRLYAVGEQETVAHLFITLIERHALKELSKVEILRVVGLGRDQATSYSPWR